MLARFQNNVRAADPRTKNQVFSKKMKVLLCGGEFEGTCGFKDLGVNGLESLVINDGAVGVDRYEIGRIRIRLQCFLNIKLVAATNDAVNDTSDLLLGGLLLLRSHLMRLLLARDEEEREDEERIGSQGDLHGIELSVKYQATNARHHSVPFVIV